MPKVALSHSIVFCSPWFLTNWLSPHSCCPVCNMSFFYGYFQNCIYLFIYWKSENNGPRYVFFLFILPGFPALLGFDIFINFGKFWLLFFQLFFCLILIVFSFWDTNYIYVWYCPTGLWASIHLSSIYSSVPQIGYFFSDWSSGLLTPLPCLIWC